MSDDRLDLARPPEYAEGGRDGEPPAGTWAVVARQPIVDSNYAIAGYELLYRTPGADKALFGDARRATMEVILCATLDIGMRQLVGDSVAYINFPPALLGSAGSLPLDPSRVVIELLEDTPCDEETLQSVRALRARGFRIALDDFDVHADGVALLALADLVKLDIQSYESGALVDAVRSLRKTTVTLIAEKVETQEELTQCRELGFNLFQGHFLRRPQLVTSRRTPSARLALLDLILKLNDPDAPNREVEDCIRRDLGLSHLVLKCINSGYFQMPRHIGSIAEALQLLGVSELQRLCWLVLLSGLNYTPGVVSLQALGRARMCELLAMEAQKPDCDSYFLVGMLSLIDAILGQTREEALRSLPLNDAVQGALLRHAGDLGSALACVERYEQGRWEEVRFGSLTSAQIADTYVRSIEWAEGVRKSFFVA